MFIDTETGEYPLTERDIKERYPMTSFATPFVPPERYAVVFATPRPAYNPITQAVREIAPALSAGAYAQAWEVYDLTQEQASANQADYVASLIAGITRDAQARLDAFAQTRNYDGILSACTYATSSVPNFAAEGQYCVDARDAMWSALYAMWAEIEAGTRPIPAGFSDLLPDLPVLAWPA